MFSLNYRCRFIRARYEIRSKHDEGRTSNDLYYDEVYSIFVSNAFYFYTRCRNISIIIEHVLGAAQPN